MKKLLFAFALGFFAFNLVSAQCSFTGLPASICSNMAAVSLTGSGAPDGVFTGSGITDNGDGTGSFDPGTAGSGSHTVTYELVDYAVASVAYSSASGSGTSVSLADNAVSGALPIGFSFDFYGKSYLQLYASSNGFITFNSGSPTGCCSGQNLPNAGTPNNLIAAAWEDLDPSGSGAPVIEYFTTGSSPNRIMIVNYTNIPHNPGTANFVTTQIKLFETSNFIEIHTSAMQSDGGNHTMGIENIDGSRATVVTGRNASNWSVTSNEGIQFTPQICQDSSVVSVSAAPSLAIMGPDTTICPGSSVMLNVMVTGGTGPFTLNIDNGVGGVNNYTNGAGITANPVTSTNYNLVSITDFNGCAADSIADSAVVTISTPSSAGVLSGDTSICNGQTANLYVNITGGTGPFSLVLDTMGTTASNYSSGSAIPVSPSATTTYSLIDVMDVYGCLGSGNSGTAVVTVNHGASSMNLMGDTATCLGIDTYLWLNISGGTGPYSITLDNSVGTISNYNSGDSILVSPFVSTTYNVLSVLDSNGCNADSLGNSHTITLNLAPTSAVLQGTATICDGDTAYLSVNITGGSAPYSIEIDNGIGILGNYASGTQIMVIPTITTTYNLLSTSDMIGCPAASVSGSPVITVTPIPATPVITQNGNVLTSSPAANYQWYLNGSPISGATSQTYTATQNGTYSVQIFDGNACSAISDGMAVTIIGLEDEFDGSFAVYPNPTTGTLNLEISMGSAAKVQVRLTNLLGVELMRTASNGQVNEFQKQLNLDNYPAGIYLLDVRIGDRRITHKVQKF